MLLSTYAEAEQQQERIKKGYKLSMKKAIKSYAAVVLTAVMLALNYQLFIFENAYIFHIITYTT